MEEIFMMLNMYFVIKNDELKNVIKFGTESARLLKIDLMVSLYTTINISKLK